MENIITSETNQNILVKSGLDFEVEKKPHFFQTISGRGIEYSKSAMSCGVFRTDTGEEIGDVSDSYAIAQYHEILAPWLQAAKDGYLNYKSGRAIENGRRFSLTFETGENKTHGEDLRRRIIIGGSHDGTWSLFMKSFIWRQICSNGLMGFGMQDSFRTKHTENWKNRYDSILSQLHNTENFFNSALGRYVELFQIPMNIERQRQATMKLLEIKGDLKEESTRKQNQLTDILTLARNGKGIRDNSEIQNTAAAWVNAVAEYVDHYSNKNNPESQYVSAYFGAGESRKKQAFEIAYAMK
jgi:phage/plasmid-like protein (TIGR03299 family)